ncbi:uncharacterized protein YtpQ (UPF0354 family) [Mycetocola sp. BIGb0189]|uniref:DUF1444 family protein n=1 Tax=Mycetocola sp. BIGb0189 TaxID=2940604 RepID=UPI00216A475E|nr:DUF1444 family protein [Mycetocola sp. BIGb0189]MCS4275123.1 uncharacterized protein YtpQ (UPF0354 family) [Mycetocola sp. BIGb0189]
MAGLFSYFRKSVAAPSEQRRSREELFEAARSRIFPLLHPITYAEPIPVRGGELLYRAHRRFTGDLGVFYQVDEGERWDVVLTEYLPEAITLEDLHALATENLRRVFTAQRISSERFGGYELRADRELASSALLMTSLWESIADELDDDLLIAVPCRDTVLFIEAGAPDAERALREVTHRLYDEQDRMRNSRQLMRFTRGEGRVEAVAR